MSYLDTIDPDRRLPRPEYSDRVARAQVRLHRLALRLYQEERSLVLVFEGWDAAGKGGAIRRITQKLDARGYQVYAIAKPDGEDARHHYLWRFWRRLLPPREKQILIFDRSWYGRVLVERVEGFASAREWKRAYHEINQFERHLASSGIMIAKFWFHISKAEQQRRFEARQATPHKQWKLTQEDWRNREKWEGYEEAVEEMLTKTSTLTAPWTVVEANDKLWARVKAVERVGEVLAAGLGEPEGSAATPETPE